MTSAEQIADTLTADIAAKFCYFSNPEKERIRRMILKAIAPLDAATRQPSLFVNVDDREAFKQQANKILALLRARGNAGAINAELCEIGLNYRARVSELRQAGHMIVASRESGRTFRYTLGTT
jgi:hypothetical protein